MQRCLWTCAALAFASVVAASTVRAAAPRSAAFEHPAIRDVLDMVDGFVASEVMVERVRRMPEVPFLDDRDIAALADEDVPERVVLELLRKRKAADACPQRASLAPAPEPKSDVKEVLRHPSVVDVLQRLDAGESSQAVIERIQTMRRMPLLDAAALRKLTSKGIPDRVLAAMVRKQSVPPDCAVPCAALMAAASVPSGKAAAPVLDEVERMAASGVIVEEIEACILRLPAAPPLDDAATARLKAAGISEVAILGLVRKSPASKPSAPPVTVAAVVPAVESHEPATKAVVPAESGAGLPPAVSATQLEPAAAPPERAGSSEAAKAKPAKKASKAERQKVAEASVPLSDRIGSGRIRVVAESSLPVTYLNVLLDGASVATQGEIHEGRVTGGWQLPPPPVLDLKGGPVVFERELPPGRYAIETAFGLSKVEKIQWDAATQAWGERYDTALAGPEPPNGDKPVCEVHDGQVCTVRAKLMKHGDGYAVSYHAKVR